MTRSQIKSLIATLAAMLAAVELKLDVLSRLLPPEVAEWVALVVMLVGVGFAAFQQSLNMNHVSIPADVAKSLGVAPEQTGAGSSVTTKDG